VGLATRVVCKMRQNSILPLSTRRGWKAHDTPVYFSTNASTYELTVPVVVLPGKDAFRIALQ
jgi:hypothetical protein